jgi:O-antigen/teichoic acid export membrane protein
MTTGIETDDDRALPVNDGLLRNAGSLLTGRVLVAIMGWTGTVLISNTLSPTQFGQFSLVFSVLGMLSVVTELGLGRVVINGVLDERRDRGAFAGNYVLLRLTLGVVGYVLALAFSLLAGYPSAVVRTMAVAGLVVLLATPSHAYNVAFVSTLKMPRLAVAEALGQAAQLAFTVVLVVHGGTLAWFAVPAVVCEIVILSAKIGPARRLLPFRYAIDTAEWWRMLREAVPISVGTALATVYYRVDSVMLSKLDTFQSVAAYGIAYKFVDLAHFVSTALSYPILTLLVRAWPEHLPAFRDGMRRGVTMLAIASTLIVTEMLVFARPLVAFLYGRYVAVAGTAKILVIAECVGYFGTFAFSVMLAAGNHRRYPVVTGIGLVLNVVLNLVLIPRYSYRGAAINTLVTEVVVAVALWWLVLRWPGLRPLGLGRLPRLGVAFGVGLGAALGARALLPWPAAALITAVVVLGAVQLVGAAGPGNLYSALRPGGEQGGHP